MYADKDFKKGQEVSWAYGHKTNIELLYGYGFLIEKNLDEFIVMEITYGSVPMSVCIEESVPKGCKYVLRPYEISATYLYFWRCYKA
jgi:hypothetical protein